jgi:hypothetical protein
MAEKWNVFLPEFTFSLCFQVPIRTLILWKSLPGARRLLVLDRANFTPDTTRRAFFTPALNAALRKLGHYPKISRLLAVAKVI